MINITEANKKVVEAFMEARPVVVGTALAKDVIPGMHADLFLHAGPPVTWERMSGPTKGAMVGALIFEGRAKTAEEAYKMLESGLDQICPMPRTFVSWPHGWSYFALDGGFHCRESDTRQQSLFRHE